MQCAAGGLPARGRRVMRWAMEYALANPERAVEVLEQARKFLADD